MTQELEVSTIHALCFATELARAAEALLREGRRGFVASAPPRLPCGCPIDSLCTGWHQDSLL